MALNPLLNYLSPVSGEDEPLQPIQQAQQQQGQLHPIGTQPNRPAPTPPTLAHFQPNAQRQLREQSLQQGLDRLGNRPAAQGFFGKAGRVQQGLDRLDNRPPAQGFWGKTGRVLEGIGNVAGTLFLGNNTMSGIPGTNQNNALKEQSGIRELQDLEGQDTADRQAFDKEQDAAAKQPLQDAQVREANARAEDLENPQPEPLQHIETDQGMFALNPRTGQLTPLTYQGKPLMKPTAPKTVNAKEQTEADLLDAEQKGDSARIKKDQGILRDMNPQAQDHLALTIQNGSEKSSKAADANTEKEYTYQRGKWDKDLGTYNSQFEKLQEAQKMVGRGAMGDAIGSIKALSGLASGMGSGVRITQAELNSIAHARGYSGDFTAFMQKFGDGRNLTPQQEQDLKSTLSQVQSLAARKTKVINQVLDDLSNATDAKTIRKIDSQARHALMGGGQ